MRSYILRGGSYRREKSLGVVIAILVMLANTISCGSVRPSANNTSRLESSKPVDVNSLCDRIIEIKIMPFKDEPVDDPAYNAIMEAGEKTIPCLIGKITDATSMPDPRSAPRYQGIDNKVGDVALWLIRRITNLDFVQFLPPQVQEDFKEEGVLAYFKYVRDETHRKELQDKLYRWYREKYGRDAV